MKPQKIKYAPLFAAMLLCVALAGCDGALHESGEGRFSQSETQDGTRAAPRADAVRAAISLWTKIAQETGGVSYESKLAEAHAQLEKLS